MRIRTEVSSIFFNALLKSIYIYAPCKEKVNLVMSLFDINPKVIKKNERFLLNASEIINHHLFLSSFRKDYCLEKSLKE